MTTQPPIALVTGGNRGIGLEVCRQLAALQYTVILGARDAEKGKRAAAGLHHPQVVACHLDVSDRASIDRAGAWVATEFGRLDVLVNNAAIHYDTWQNAINADFAIVEEAMQTNVYGAWWMVQAFLPLLRKSTHGRIVNVSSQAGSLATMGEGTPAYSVSKAALNALTCILAAELRASRILVNAVCPGWVATDMGGSGGRPVKDGAASVVWAVTIPDDGPTGGFFRDGQPLAW
jgi:NAD(P)-dependent dehydrogenase (short-subunit alcohol dehydrogenase family)